MNIQEVVVKKRDITGKEESGRIRRSGMIPAVVYGLKLGAVSIALEPKVIGKVLASDKGLNTVLHLRLEGTEETRHVMIKDLTRHPVTDKILHVDFLRVDMEKKIEVTFPIEFVGTPEGVKMGGIFTQVRHEIPVRCLPAQLRGSLVVDVTALEIGQTIRVRDLTDVDGLEILVKPERVLAVVSEKDAEIISDAEGDDD